MKKYTYLLIAFALVLHACQKDVTWVPDEYAGGAHEIPQGEYVTDNSFKVVAYYAEANELDSIEEAKFKMITHLHYAFAYPNPDGTIKAITKPANFSRAIKLARDNGAKVAVSFSGSEAVYSAIAADSLIRNKLVDNIVAFALKNQLDGVDIDWEYPRANLSNDITFELFMKSLSAKLHKYHLYLSAAVTAGVYAGNVRDGISAGAIEACDFINLMAYDGSGWAGDPNHSSYKLAEDVLDVWFNIKNLPKEKAVLGVPNYGKTPGNESFTFRDLLLKGADPRLNSFQIETISLNGTPVTKIYYYNGLELMKDKAMLAKNQANGIMFWELFQDVNGPNSLIKAAVDTIGISY